MGTRSSRSSQASPRSGLPSLRDLLEARVAVPADVSPDGGTVLVGSNLTGTMQLYRLPVAGGNLEALTDLPEPVTGSFLPDGRRVLLEMDEGGNERTQLYLLDAEPGASPEPLVVDPDFIHRAPFVSADGALLAYSSNRRNGTDFDVYVRALAGGEERRVFAPGGFCEVAGFSPDSRWLAVVRLTERSGDNDLYLVDVESGEAVHASPHDDEAYFGAPAWLADSESFHFATNQARDTIGIARYDLGARSWEYVLESEWDLECYADRSGSQLLVEANEDGYSRLELRSPDTLAVQAEVPLPGRGVVYEPHFSRGGRRLAFNFTSPRIPGDVWVYDGDSGESTRLTRSPAAIDEQELVEPELHRFASFDGERIPVFLFRPQTDEPAPVVVTIHGGPEAQMRPIFSPLTQYFVSHGYVVAGPNVRGSTGYGKRFEHLDDVRLRLDSVRDLVALHDWLGGDPRVDASRTVLYGASYGGYMVLAGLAFHPDRWAAGLDVVGISSLVTFLENTAPWRRAFREREYGSLARDRDFLEEVSPITRVDDIRAPLFIVHGANDPRVPLGEAEQLYRALSERGVRCELLVYPDEGHGLGKLQNRLDAYPKAVAFLEEVLDG
jgi:dipeptidyl aminopeptidase/acylaminoacyl peptidase